MIFVCAFSSIATIWNELAFSYDPLPGCPPQAIVHAFELDERTVARWQERAGAHCQNIHKEQVMQAQLDLQHVQADEIRAKGYKMIPWIAMAVMVSTRLWLGGAVSLTRDRHLADQLMQMIKACCWPLPRSAQRGCGRAYPCQRSESDAEQEVEAAKEGSDRKVQRKTGRN